MESPIFIGIAEPEVISDNNQFNWIDNHVGGKPIFSPKIQVSLSDDQTICSNCSSNLAFIFQISCSIDNSTNDRVLYFFLCINPDCKEKEYAIYRVITTQVINEKVIEKDLFENEWNVETDDDYQLAEKFDHCVTIHNKINQFNENCRFFKSYYISVFEEPGKKELIFNKKEDKKIETLVQGCMGEQDSSEIYEKQYSDAFKTDKANYQFYKRLRRCPEQIIRYEWMGQPLFSTDNVDIVKPDCCHNCGSERTFELQIMPGLIGFLSHSKLSNTKAVDIDFETILVYTCKNNCSSPNIQYFKEQLFVFKENYKL
ncbi:programmed cell death protein [Blomia tropicalis]|nr:programmed cell death protein [Blomia tropicalis]